MNSKQVYPKLLAVLFLSLCFFSKPSSFVAANPGPWYYPPNYTWGMDMWGKDLAGNATTQFLCNVVVRHDNISSDSIMYVGVNNQNGDNGTFMVGKPHCKAKRRGNNPEADMKYPLYGGVWYDQANQNGIDATGSFDAYLDVHGHLTITNFQVVHGAQILYQQSNLTPWAPGGYLLQVTKLK